MTRTKTENFKATVAFIDAKRHKVIVKLELKDGKFSATGDCGGSSGQCQDSIAPATDAQRRLLATWGQWHLNDMTAGTPEQEAALAAARKVALHDATANSFDWATALLKSQGLYEVPHPDKPGEVYRYGSAWLTRELPEDFLEELERLVDDLRTEKSTETKLEDIEEHLELVSEELSITESDAELALALGIMFGLTVAEISDIDVDDAPRVTVQGIDYLAGDDSAMDKAWDESLDNYLDECVLGELQGAAKDYFDRERWKDDAKHDGRGHALNRQDGGEDEATVNGTTYYAYRQ